jgi:hypothetical protein
MPPAVSEPLLRVQRLQHDIQLQFLSTFYIYLANQQGTSAEYLARLYSILHLLKGLETSVIALLDFLLDVSLVIERYKEQGSMT